MRVGTALFTSFLVPEDDFPDTTFSSANVFHLRQAGHCPIHFADSYPQF